MSRKTWIILILLVGTQKATAFKKQYSRVLKKKKKRKCATVKHSVMALMSIYFRDTEMILKQNPAHECLEQFHL